MIAPGALLLSLLPRRGSVGGGGGGGLGADRVAQSAIAAATSSRLCDGALLSLAALAEATPALSAAFTAALELVDAGAVVLASAPSGGGAFLVQPGAGRRPARGGGGGGGGNRGGGALTVLPGYCSCGSEYEPDDVCAHRLAVHLAAACESFSLRPVSDAELAAILQGS